MGFRDIEQFLRQFFDKTVHHSPENVKERVKEEVLARFHQKKEQNMEHWYVPFFAFCRKKSVLVAFGVGIIALFNVFPGDLFLEAGRLYPTNGLVEVTRDGETTVVKDVWKLKVGDIVRVGSNAEAEVVFPGVLESNIGDKTAFRVIENGALYVQKGTIQSTLFEEGNITTNRGIVRSDDGSVVRVVVSETGETTVLSETEKTSVFDWNNGEQVLQAGEEIRLRTDTILTDMNNTPKDIKLSLDQILAVRSKLAIARTKAVSGLEHLALGKDSKAEKSFVSAKQTYRSIIQVLNSSRDLSLVTRKNLDLVDLRDVAMAMQKKDMDKVFVDEARALQVLFELQAKQKKVSFNEEFTGVSTFDRYRLVDRLFAEGNEEQKALGELLEQRYVVAFLQDVQNEELVIDQISLLNEYIKLLPKTTTTETFLSKVQKRFDPNLAKILEEKIVDLFT